jgi:hypothetical protein
MTRQQWLYYTVYKLLCVFLCPCRLPRMYPLPAIIKYRKWTKILLWRNYIIRITISTRKSFSTRRTTPHLTALYFKITLHEVSTLSSFSFKHHTSFAQTRLLLWRSSRSTRGLGTSVKRAPADYHPIRYTAPPHGPSRITWHLDTLQVRHL